MSKNTSYTNRVTYTTAGHDGARHENSARIESRKPLTETGAQRIVRRTISQPRAIVTRVETSLRN